MKWFRLYTEVVNDPKVQRLHPAKFKLWISLLCLAAENDGYLPEDCHFRVRLRSDRCQKYVRELTEDGLFEAKNGRVRVHNWEARQWISDTNAERQRRFREKQRNVTVTAPEADTDNRYRQTDTDKQQQDCNIFELYESVFGRLNGIVKTRLLEIQKEYPPEWIQEAFERAALKPAYSLRYVERTLEGWIAEEARENARKLEMWPVKG